MRGSPPILAIAFAMLVAVSTVILWPPATGDPPIEGRVVSASCGQCQFGLEGGGCTLAVEIGGQAYYVQGTDIDDHGDAHASDGFCEAIREAKVTGTIQDDNFDAIAFQLLPAPEEDAQ